MTQRQSRCCLTAIVLRRSGAAHGDRRRADAGQRRLHRRSATPRSQKRARDAQRRRPDDRLLVFRQDPGMKFVFRKRALKPGSGIGYHEQKEDEVYYVLSGKGVMTVDGKAIDVGPGTAVLTRPGSSHGLKQVGD